MDTATIRDVYDQPVEVEILEKQDYLSSIFVGDRLVLWPTEVIEFH